MELIESDKNRSSITRLKHLKAMTTITNNDSKILGRNLQKRKEKTMPSTQFQTSKFKTEKSNWTPIVHKPSNEQIYKERRELICNWFELWTDSQRRRFLDAVFTRCRRAQLAFIQQWFNSRVPLRHVDFSRVLPRFLTLYILSFLDPRSLCRAAAVCWQWKFLAEQDTLWMRKCTRLGWYLPYTPPPNEYGAWKKHYLVCMQSLDTTRPTSAPTTTLELTHGEKSSRQGKSIERSLSIAASREMLSRRPPWLPPDYHPQDLEQGWRCLLQQFNPNDNATPASQLLYHNKFGILKSLLLSRSDPGEQTTFGEQVPLGLQSAGRLQQHRLLQDGGGKCRSGRDPLSRSLQLENYDEKRLMELVHQPWQPPTPNKILFPRRPDLSGGADYPVPWQDNAVRSSKPGSHPSIKTPRVIFISSRVPAAELLVDAILFGVIPIVYEYEGTTLENLMTQLDNCLQGRDAQSIGIFVHSTVPWEINLVHGSTVVLENLNESEIVDFASSLANHVLPSASQGHVDIFAPVASCESGTEMLLQLTILTGIPFSSPNGVVGNYNHINGPWSENPESSTPTDLYFCATKVNVWTSMADQVQEACHKTKTLIGRYFEQQQTDLVSQLVGQVILDATGRLNITRFGRVTDALTEGLIEMEKTQEVDPLEFIGKFLMSKAANKFQKTIGDLSEEKADGGHLVAVTTHVLPAAVQMAASLTGLLELDENFEASLEGSDGRNGAKTERRNRSGVDEDKDRDSADDGEGTGADNGSIAEEIEGSDGSGEVDRTAEGVAAMKGTAEGVVAMKGTAEGVAAVKGTAEGVAAVKGMPELKRSKSPVRQISTLENSLQDTSVWGTTQSTIKKVMTNIDPSCVRLDQTDRRTAMAKEILSSEITYNQALNIVRAVFYKPLKSALDSNRAILSLQNINILFADQIILLDLSRDLLADVRARVADWQADSCIGDVFVKFSGRLKVYVNFFNNYPVILRNMERCVEQTPAFRAFLRRHEATPEARMLTLPQLLLKPSERIAQYVVLLSAFRAHTPPDHADQADLKAAITTLHELNSLVQQFKLRGERERELALLQKQIVSCPALMEANRYFLKQLDVNHLQTSAHPIDVNCRTYHHFKTLGLFLFNDSLVVTRRTSRHLPFERSVEHTYHFETCASLTRLRVRDIPDSKYVQNAMQLFTPKRQWTCCTKSADEKRHWISLLENTIRSQLH